MHDAFTYPLNLLLTYNQSSNGTLYDYGVMLQHSYDRVLSAPGFTGRTIKTTQIGNGSQVRERHELS
jgi:hypothetical protein